MKSLFLKMFLFHWMAQALFLVVAVLITIATRPQNELQEPDVSDSAMHETVRRYESGGQPAAGLYLEGLRSAGRYRSFLFDDQGRELSGHEPPELVVKAALNRLSSVDGFFGRIFQHRMQRHELEGASGREYVFVTEWHSRTHTIFGPGGMPGVGLSIAVFSSGLVCLLMARYLSAPVVRLRAATQALAAGNLSARAGSPRFRRRDEIAGLMRDFDTMAERLEMLLNAQSRLLKDISHELRSPLARLNVALELARQRSGPEAETALDRIDLESNRLNELIGSLLTLARLESGKDAQEKSRIDLASLIAEIARDADFEAASRNCRVDAVVVDECSIVGSAALIHSAVENVARNAIRYTREGTKVQIRLQCETAGSQSQAVIQVIDSGPGVPEEALDKLFRPFYRIDDARGRQTGGAGLGLAITERAAKMHGGTVRASNRREGGMMVEMRFPMAMAPLLRPDVLEPVPSHQV